MVFLFSFSGPEVTTVLGRRMSDDSYICRASKMAVASNDFSMNRTGTSTSSSLQRFQLVLRIKYQFVALLLENLKVYLQRSLIYFCF